jgi:hypothetical protein
MLGEWRSHSDYQNFVAGELALYARFDPRILYEYEDIISKLYILDLDRMKPVIAPLYSHTGRKSMFQPEIFRTSVIMSHLKIPIDGWREKLRNSPVLRIAAGFPVGYLPGVASFYDFMNRICRLDERPRVKHKKRKPRKKYGKGDKMPPKHPGIVDKLVGKILAGRRFNHRPERFLQAIFARVSVDVSVGMGLVGNGLTLSGDGTCMHTGASPYGRKICDCRENGVYNCDCPRRFSDPNASWGWSGHNEKYFYGYTGYFLSAYNKPTKTDLPLLLRLADAKRHDSVMAVVALAEFRDLHPNISVETFLSDSASDNRPTYELLEAWNINAVIALNDKRGRKNELPGPLDIGGNGVPLCPAGHRMTHWGTFNEAGRIRTKWRCPCKTGKAEPGDACAGCSSSSCGRVIYTKPESNIRIFTRIPRGTPLWKKKMKERTAAERVNNRILNHYGMEHTRQRGKKRISFFTTVAAVNIHLDAQLAKLKADGLFDFKGTFGISDAA